MAGEVEMDEETLAVGDASNVLLLAPSLGGTGDDACLHLLARSPPERTSVLAIAYTESPAEFVDRWTSGTGARPARGGIVTVGETDVALAEEAWTVEEVGNPADLTSVGIELSDLLSKLDTAADDGGSVVVCFNSLTMLLQYADLQRAFRFLHVVTGRVKSAGALGHYHLNPDAHDQQTLATLRSLFDTVVEVDADGSWSVQR